MVEHFDNLNEGQGPKTTESDEERIADLEGRVVYLERIAKLSQILNSTLELGPLLQLISQVGIELAETEGCSILLYDDETNYLKFMPSTYATDDDVVVPIPTFPVL